MLCYIRFVISIIYLGDDYLKNYLKRITTLIFALFMVLTLPLQAFADSADLILLLNKRDSINNLAVSPYKLSGDEKESDFLKDKGQPDIYTYRTNFNVQKDVTYKKNYQPYVASVGESISEEEKAKVNKTINLPVLTGYIKPQETFSINYDEVKSQAEKGITITKDGVNIHQNEQDFKYEAKIAKIKVKHLFQKLKDFNKYANKDGSEDLLIEEQSGSTGSILRVQPLDKKHFIGFEPEAAFIMTQVPEDITDFEMEYRYNRAYFDVLFDCEDGTPIPARTLYFEQKIPKIASGDMPTKSGMDLKGWKPSVDLKANINGVDTTFKKDEIMKDASGNPSLNLDLNLQMPSEKVTFTAVWERKNKANYTVLLWAEKADYPKNAKLLDKYDFVGTHVYKDQPVGMRPELDKEPVKGVEFTDLDASRLKRIYNGEKVKVNDPKSNKKMEIPYLNKFYLYNQALTDKENADNKHPNLVKEVSSTGETVYNIYYDRQVYNLWFTKGSFDGSFYPTLIRNGEVLGKPGSPYHFEARFNQSLVGMWPNDILEVSGFKDDYNSLGWRILQESDKSNYRDTPPYRLTANEFVDYPELSKNGLAREIPMGQGVASKKAGPFDIAFGIDQHNQVFPIHEDFLLDGFEQGEQNYDYDLYMVKSDTNNTGYDFTPPDLQGFTSKGKKKAERFDQYDLEEKNDEERNVKTPFPKVYYRFKDKRRQKGKLYFMGAFPKINSLNGEENEDPKKPIEDLEEDENEDSGDNNFDENGYLVFEYARNKYELKLNNDPSKEKDDSAYTGNDKIQVFYDYPLKNLNLDQVHKPEKPKGIPDQWEFKGWSMDTKGQKFVWKSDEKMPARNLVLYAQWGEPDYKWKVTFDANGGTLPSINTDNLTFEKKTIVEGDIGQEKEVTYPINGEKTGDKEVFTVVQHQKLKLPEKPKRKGYEFRGWELIRYQRDKDGNYTDVLDTDYSRKYREVSGCPELYAFGNDVVSPIYLRAIWVPTDTVDVKVKHYFLDENFNLDKSILKNTIVEEIEDKRVNYLAASIGDQQNEEWILATDEELMAHNNSDIFQEYKDYNDRVKFNNTYFQTFRVEPENIVDQKTGVLIKNPNFENNIFKYFYRRYKTRKYKVNYVDVRAKEAIENATDPLEKERLIRENSIMGQEKVISACRDFDVRNYRPIPGWVLAKDEKPQKQLFYDIDEDTNRFLGINGSGSDEINFYYQDARVIELQNTNEPIPNGYTRVTFKASDGGSFGKDDNGNEIKEINYDVIKGIKFGLLPVPQLSEGENIADKHYIVPDIGKKFTGWEEELNKNTLIEENYIITAKFDDENPDAKDNQEAPDDQNEPSKPENQDPSDDQNEPKKPENPNDPNGSDNDLNPSKIEKPEDPNSSEPELPLNPEDNDPSHPDNPEDNRPGLPLIPKENNFEYPVIPDRFYNQVNSDLQNEAYFQNKVEEKTDKSYLKEVRYIQGFHGDFRPKDGLTRAEAAQILANALIEDGYNYHTNFKISYRDIGESWYTRAIKIVTEARVFAGYNNGNFNPQKKITRNEWISTLKRFQELSNVSGNHMNLKAGHWATSEVEAAYKEGWLKIYEEGKVKYEGDKFITREEVVALSNKAFNRVIDKDYIEKNNKNLKNYRDIRENMWSYDDILSASNTFLYQGSTIKAHLIEEDKNTFNIDTSGFEIKQEKFERIPR